MLRFLSIRHLAVIDQLEIDLEPGLTVLTGETGAGKSMLVEALDLLVGGRASADLVRTGEDTATVQAIFEWADGRESIVRREVSAQGRSRAFIDDALATTTALREFGGGLVDLHGQHEHQALLNPEAHGPLLDENLGAPELLASVAERFAAWREARAALDRTQLSEREKAARIELINFHLAEIDKVGPKPAEDDQLSAERVMLANADRLNRVSTEAYAALYDGEHAALASLSTVWKRVADLAELDPKAQPYLDQRDDIKSRLEDLAFFLRGYAAELDASPARLQDVEDRLAALERLKRKHGPALSNVIDHRAALRAELDALGASEEQASRLAERAADAAEAFVAVARQLSATRRKVAASLGKRLEGALASLAMPKCRVDIRTKTSEHDEARWTSRGIDDVEFYLSPNPGEELRPLARIASGGELSRVMLALHGLSAGAAERVGDAVRTLVFDEVDAGIGGEAADAVGAELQQLASRCQVLCITHLPQIAARGDVHLVIDKQVKAGRTVTTIARLDRSGREQELARMIAGAAISPAVVASAREMLTGRQRGEQKPKGESESRPRAKAKATRGA
jgi:DNA repair protein RecN (Recombination protein N)